MWWMVDVGFSHMLDEGNLTPTQEKCLDLDIDATNILFRSLHDCFVRSWTRKSPMRFGVI